MKSRPVRAEVCLEAAKTASRGKTKPGNCGKMRRKGEKIRLEDAIRLENERFFRSLFSRAENVSEECRALAPEGRISKAFMLLFPCKGAVFPSIPKVREIGGREFVKVSVRFLLRPFQKLPLTEGFQLSSARVLQTAGFGIVQELFDSG